MKGLLLTLILVPAHAGFAQSRVRHGDLPI